MTIRILARPGTVLGYAVARIPRAGSDHLGDLTHTSLMTLEDAASEHRHWVRQGQPCVVVEVRVAER